MRFVDLLRVSVLLCAAAATVLAAACVIGASARQEPTAVTVAVGWWLVALALGGWLGRRAAVSEGIGRSLAQARPATALPEQRPGAVVVNRLWPLLVVLVVGGGLAVVAPQVPGVAAGFAMLAALAGRRQEGAVTAIEERDGVTFYVERTSPVRPVRLVRVPGFRREVPTMPTA